MNDRFDQLVQQGLDASRLDDTEAALAAWQAAAIADSASPIPHFLIGAECAQARRLDDAEAALANAVLLGPSLHIARFQLGLLQFSSGRVAPALLTWQPLLELPDTHALRSFVLGFAALASDDFPTALQHFEHGSQANTDNPPLNRDVALVVAGIHRLVANAQSQPAAPAEHDSPDSPDPHHSSDANDQHVLLAAYRQHGPAH